MHPDGDAALDGVALFGVKWLAQAAEKWATKIQPGLRLSQQYTKMPFRATSSSKLRAKQSDSRNAQITGYQRRVALLSHEETLLLGRPAELPREQLHAKVKTSMTDASCPRTAL